MFEFELKGEIGKEVNDVVLNSFLDEADGQDLTITINTIGGCVDTAFRMYDALEDYKIINKAVVTTITDEMCASSGIILLLAGNRRIVNKNTKPFIHDAFLSFENGASASANELINLGFEVENINFRIAKLYSQKTALNYDEARELMGLETFFTPEEAYAIGLATELSRVYNKLEPKIIIENKLKLKNENTMALTNEEKSFFDMVKNFFAPSQTTIKNKVEMTVADVEITFPEVEEGSDPKVGDKATIDGQPAEGEYIMKKGLTYKFEGGILTEIEEEVVEVDPMIEELEGKIVEFENKISEMQSIINKLEETNKENESKIEKFNKLETEFQKFNKKENKSKEVEVENKIDFASMANRLKQMKK